MAPGTKKDPMAGYCSLEQVLQATKDTLGREYPQREEQPALTFTPQALITLRTQATLSDIKNSIVATSSIVNLIPYMKEVIEILDQLTDYLSTANIPTNEFLNNPLLKISAKVCTIGKGQALEYSNILRESVAVAEKFYSAYRDDREHLEKLRDASHTIHFSRATFAVDLSSELDKIAYGLDILSNTLETISTLKI